MIQLEDIFPLSIYFSMRLSLAETWLSFLVCVYCINVLAGPQTQHVKSKLKLPFHKPHQHTSRITVRSYTPNFTTHRNSVTMSPLQVLKLWLTLPFPLLCGHSTSASIPLSSPFHLHHDCSSFKSITFLLGNDDGLRTFLLALALIPLPPNPPSHLLQVSFTLWKPLSDLTLPLNSFPV